MSEEMKYQMSQLFRMLLNEPEPIEEMKQYLKDNNIKDFVIEEVC
jgi:hypothetical protein